jgi:hypothetical protein
MYGSSKPGLVKLSSKPPERSKALRRITAALVRIGVDEFDVEFVVVVVHRNDVAKRER